MVAIKTPESNCISNSYSDIHITSLIEQECKMKNSTTFHNNLSCSTDKVGDHDSSDDHVSDDFDDIKDEHINDDDDTKDEENCLVKKNKANRKKKEKETLIIKIIMQT